MAAEVKTVFTADDRDMIKSLEKQVAAQKRVNEGLQKQVTSLKSVKRAAGDTRREASAGAEAFSKLGRSMLAIAGPAVVLAGALKTIQSVTAEAARGAGVLTEEAAAGIKLRQVAGGDTAKERAANVEALKKIVRRYTTGTTQGLTNQAMVDMLFSMKSAPGILPTSDLDMLTKLGMLTTDPAEMTKNLVQTQTVFEKGRPAGTNRQVLNQMFVAGKMSGTLTPEELVPNAVSMMGMFRDQGLKFEEALSWVGQFAPGFKGPEESATAGTAFAKFARIKGFKGSLLQQFRQFEKLPKQEKEELITSNIRFARGFSAISESKEKFQASLDAMAEAKADTGTIRDEMSVGLKAFALDPEQVAAAQTTRAREVEKMRAREEGIGYSARDLAGSLGTSSLESAWQRGVSDALSKYLEMVQPVFDFQPSTIRQATEITPVLRSIESGLSGKGLNPRVFRDVKMPGPIRTESAVE